MPRVQVVTETPNPQVLADEQVLPVHWDSQHASLQLIERLADATDEAAQAEGRLRGVTESPVTPRSYLQIIAG